MALTDAKIKGATPGDRAYRLPDGGGLFLEVRASGAKAWLYRYRIDGRENIFTIGSYGGVSLADARRERDHARDLVRRGIHPAHKRKAERMESQPETFETVAREWLHTKKATLSDRYLAHITRVLEQDVFPGIGNSSIRAVTPAHVLRILRSIEGRGAATVALLARQVISSTFRHAIATLRADADPASVLHGAIHRPKVKHHKPLTLEQARALFLNAGRYTGNKATGIALRLLMMTFTRTAELRGARWEEVDLQAGVWTIPPERMKSRVAHIVPLSKQALDLLRELHTLTGDREYLFPNTRNPKSFLSATTLNKALDRLGLTDFSAHGFRATASTILNEAGFRSDAIERQLAHTERDRVRASYNRGLYMNERRKMMQVWADMVTRPALKLCA